MKLLLLSVLCLSCVGVSAAQEAAESGTPPGVTVVGHKWSREISSPRPYEPPTFDASRGGPAGQTRSSSPVAVSPFPPSGRLPSYYVYSLTVRNGGRKSIKAVAWEHTFTDAGGNRVLGRHQFASYDKKGGGDRRATFRAASASAPSKVVTPEGLAEDECSPYTERAQLRCVLYKDGTLWEHPAARDAGCDWLRRAEARRKALRRRL